MPKFILKAKSSGAEPYDVDFIFEDGVLQVFCGCKAGAMGTACKHRIALLRGDQTMLSDQSQSQEFATVLEWAKKTGFPALLERLDGAEADLARAQAELSTIKKQVAQSMTRGLKATSTSGVA